MQAAFLRPHLEPVYGIAEKSKTLKKHVNWMLAYVMQKSVNIV